MYSTLQLKPYIAKFRLRFLRKIFSSISFHTFHFIFISYFSFSFHTSHFHFFFISHFSLFYNFNSKLENKRPRMFRHFQNKQIQCIYKVILYFIVMSAVKNHWKPKDAIWDMLPLLKVKCEKYISCYSFSFHSIHFHFVLFVFISFHCTYTCKITNKYSYFREMKWKKYGNSV